MMALKINYYILFLILPFVISCSTENSKNNDSKVEVNQSSDFRTFELKNHRYKIKIDIPVFFDEKYNNIENSICFSPICLKDSTGYEYFSISFEQNSESHFNIYNEWKKNKMYFHNKLPNEEFIKTKIINSNKFSFVSYEFITTDTLNKFYHLYAKAQIAPDLICNLKYKISKSKFDSVTESAIQSVKTFEILGIDSTYGIWGME
jgi:hypothetical protein